jgi:hypothetical protein
MSDYVSSSVLHGLTEGEFSNLPPTTRKKLLRLMARVSEASYRRGYQHGCFFTSKGVVGHDPTKLRFDTSLDIAPFTNAEQSGHMTSLERFICEYPVCEVGL